MMEKSDTSHKNYPRAMKSKHSPIIFSIVNIIIIVLFIPCSLVIFYTSNSLTLVLFSIVFSVLLFVLTLAGIFHHLKFKAVLLNKLHQCRKIQTSLFKLSDILFNATHRTFSRITSCFGDNNSYKFKIDDMAADFLTITNLKHHFTSLNNAEKNNNPEFVTENLKNATSQLELNIEVLFGKLEDIQYPLIDDLIKRLAVYENKDLFHHLIAKQTICSNIITTFIAAITLNSNTTGEKVSGKILNIRKNIDLFLNNISIWKNDFLSKTSDINFEKLISQYKIQNTQFSEISIQVSNNYNDIIYKLNNFKSLLENIFKNIEFIKDISESINVLSINAAIEAARVGEKGNGFRIIAGEIKKLLAHTESFVRSIKISIEDTKSIVVSTTEESKMKAKQIVDKISFLKNDTNNSYNMLDVYYKNFYTMIESMKSLTEEVKEHMDDFTVILQHFDIEEQELDNLSKIIQTSMSNNHSQVETIVNSIENEERNKIFKDLLDYVNNIITTQVELKTLEGLYREYGISSEIRSIQTEPNIELFQPLNSLKE